MTNEEYRLSFGQWVNEIKGEELELSKYGDIIWSPDRNNEIDRVKSQWHDLWIAERSAYCLQKKNEDICHALEAIKAKGFTCRLMDYNNAHILAVSKNGKKMSYYATTGTITGYRDTPISGVSEFIRLLGEI